ncbi:MAG: hypothetical protein JWM33_2228 [Caulobacteraceae bacterium]|nr:hypothetical protein [Caulobacteraceae bacterium]
MTTQLFDPALDQISPIDHVRRVVDLSARATLERLAAAGQAEDGRLCLIGLGAIADRLGSRWAARKDAVYDHVQRGLEGRLSGDAVFVRVSETDYLISQPSLEKSAAQGICLRFMRETLRHFLGDASNAEVAVMEVRHMDGQSIQAATIDTLAIAVFAEMPYAALAGKTRPAPAPLPPPNPWSPFVASDGRELHVSCYLQRMINLKTYESIGYRVGRFVVAGALGRLTPLQMSVMSRADIERIDKASIYQGLNMLKERKARPIILALPLSFTTLNNMRGRSMLATAFKEAAPMVSGGLIAGVYDVEGAPPGALSSASALLRPFCLKVFANLHAPTKADIRRLRGGGLNGIGVHCPHFEGDAEFIGWTRAVVQETHHVTGTVTLHGLKTERRAAMAATLGVTHATMWEEDAVSNDLVLTDDVSAPSPATRALGVTDGGMLRAS